jgi:hypothetical protein
MLDEFDEEIDLMNDQTFGDAATSKWIEAQLLYLYYFVWFYNL